MTLLETELKCHSFHYGNLKPSLGNLMPLLRVAHQLHAWKHFFFLLYDRPSKQSPKHIKLGIPSSEPWWEIITSFNSLGVLTRELSSFHDLSIMFYRSKWNSELENWTVFHWSLNYFKSHVLFCDEREINYKSLLGLQIVGSWHIDKFLQELNFNQTVSDAIKRVVFLIAYLVF